MAEDGRLRKHLAPETQGTPATLPGLSNYTPVKIQKHKGGGAGNLNHDMKTLNSIERIAFHIPRITITSGIRSVKLMYS